MSYYFLNSERAGTLIQQGEHCDISQIPVDSSSYKSALCGECDTNQSESREKLQIISRDHRQQSADKYQQKYLQL